MALAKIAACALSAAALAAPLALGGTARAVPASPQSYYLALGDSIAYGFQPAKMSAGLPPSGFDTGYVDIFAARLRGLVPKIRVVNYGCPGESAKTFIGGGCPWLGEGRRLHDGFRGPQLDAALAFLRMHRDQVSPITLTLWGNDVAEFSEACKGKLACIRARAPRALSQLASRLGLILRRLRAAAPKAEIIITGAWNAPVIITGTNSVAAIKQTDPLFRSVHATIARVAAGAQARVADISPAFSPSGSLSRTKARICTLTFACSDGDPHPTDAGYRAMAAAFLAASGYTHRS